MDGLFVYAVTSTGVFCRPGCRSRRPLQRNVLYFETPSAAQTAGFRACKRCRPDEMNVVDASVALAEKVCRRLEDLTRSATTADIARELGYHERYLRQQFLLTVGVTPAQYRRGVQASRARQALVNGHSVSEAVLDAQYGSHRAFYEHAAPTLGMSPRRFRDGGRGETLRVTTLETARGVVALACTERGLCDVRLGEDETILLAEIREAFPHAELRRDDDSLFEVALALGRATQGLGGAEQLPLDVEGTVFQIRVWRALREIPLGETRSYADVARTIGSPSAVRAVASACAANHVALAIPCHRVRRSDGSLGGYRWGVEVKAAVLNAEATTRARHV